MPFGSIERALRVRNTCVDFRLDATFIQVFQHKNIWSFFLALLCITHIAE